MSIFFLITKPYRVGEFRAKINNENVPFQIGDNSFSPHFSHFSNKKEMTIKKTIIIALVLPQTAFDLWSLFYH